LWTIWGGSWVALSLPVLAYVGTLSQYLVFAHTPDNADACQATGLGLDLACLDGEYGGPIHQSALLHFYTPFLSLSAALNIMATGLIAFHLLRQRHRMHAVGVSSSPGPDLYTSVSAMLIESAAFYTITTVVYIPFRVLESDVALPLSALMGAASILSPALIQLRVSRGVMYGRATTTQTTDHSTYGAPIRFATMGTSHPDTLQSSVAWSDKAGSII
jgi:hypothetical protein